MDKLNNPIGIKSFEPSQSPFIMNPFRFASGGGGLGGWVELGRTTLGSAGDTISVSSLDNKRYYMVLQNILHSGDAPDATRLGNSSIDSGTNYSNHYSINGAADNTFTSINRCIDYTPTVSSDESFAVSYLSNLSGNEKLMLKQRVGRQAAGAGTAPNRSENANKWANTSNPLDIFQVTNISSGDYLTGSEVVVLGWDPADTHTTNFWEELASVTSGSTVTNINSGTFTAKKYLWVQVYLPSGQSAVTQNILTRFNGDSGNNYARRESANGGADGTTTSTSSCLIVRTGIQGHFINYFIINNSANEKLVIAHMNEITAIGAGTAPFRSESVHKWTNTASQITSIDVNISPDTFSNAEMRVWGSD